MDAREVPKIGIINSLPFKLVAYPDIEMTMIVLVVDIPPYYGMLLSRKWSAAMGASLQCNLSYITFHIEYKSIKIDMEPRFTYIFEDSIDKDATCFLDIEVNAFRVELIIQEIEKPYPMITQEVTKCLDSQKIWTMYFDGASSREGLGVGIVFISPKKINFRYSFTLNFTCTNNVAKYEALLLGLKVSVSHGIKMLHGIGDSKLILSQVKEKYASKNKRLK